MSAEEYEASVSAPAAASGSVGLGSRSVVYAGTDGSGVLGRAGGPRIEDGNESDNISWSLAGGSEQGVFWLRDVHGDWSSFSN